MRDRGAESASSRADVNGPSGDCDSGSRFILRAPLPSEKPVKPLRPLNMSVMCEAQ